jgi:hypothetical protein
MTGEIFRFQIPSWALIILIFLSPNHASESNIANLVVDWINPPSPGPANWMVGEQQNLSWQIGDSSGNGINASLVHPFKISLVQELPGGNAYNESSVVIYGIIYLFYMLLIFNYVKLHATLKQTNKYEDSQNSEDDSNVFPWTVQLYGFNLTFSNVFLFLLPELIDNNGDDTTPAYSTASPPFNIITSAPTLGSTTTLSTPTTSSPPSSAPLDGLSGETFGIALGIGIPGLLAILVTLFVLLKLLKRKRLPNENSTSCQQISEVAGDFLYGAELSGNSLYRAEPSGDPPAELFGDSPYFAELPATECS